MKRNWKKICEITSKGQENWYLLMLISHTDPDSELGKRLVGAFPEYYSDTEIESEQIPWSVLVEEGRRNFSPDENRFPDELATNGTLKKYNIPYVRYSCSDENHLDYAFPLLPKEVALQCHFGRIISLNGQKYVVTESVLGKDTPEEACLSPIERILIKK